MVIVAGGAAVREDEGAVVKVVGVLAAVVRVTAAVPASLDSATPVEVSEVEMGMKDEG